LILVFHHFTNFTRHVISYLYFVNNIKIFLKLSFPTIDALLL
jgi:hypothetical protein